MKEPQRRLYEALIPADRELLDVLKHADNELLEIAWGLRRQGV